MVSCSGFGLPMHAQLLRLFVTQTTPPATRAASADQHGTHRGRNRYFSSTHTTKEVPPLLHYSVWHLKHPRSLCLPAYLPAGSCHRRHTWGCACGPGPIRKGAHVCCSRSRDTGGVRLRDTSHLQPPRPGYRWLGFHAVVCTSTYFHHVSL